MEKKPDFSFVASLIIIIIVALYFGMDFFQKSNLSEYLEKTGNELLSKITDQNDRKSLEKSYAELLAKIEKKEISAKKAEQLAANLINLKQAKDHLNTEELRVILMSTLHNAEKKDSLKILVESRNNERWLVLNERIENIQRFEKGLVETQLEDRPLNNSGSFDYAVDDSLHIIADDRYKGELIQSRPGEYKDEIIVLEQEHLLKWTKDLNEHLAQELKMVKKNIALTKFKEKRLNISSPIHPEASKFISISTAGSDSLIEFHFNFDIPAAIGDSILHNIPHAPEIPVD